MLPLQRSSFTASTWCCLPAKWIRALMASRLHPGWTWARATRDPAWLRNHSQRRGWRMGAQRQSKAPACYRQRPRTVHACRSKLGFLVRCWRSGSDGESLAVGVPQGRSAQGYAGGAIMRRKGTVEGRAEPRDRRCTVGGPPSPTLTCLQRALTTHARASTRCPVANHRGDQHARRGSGIAGRRCSARPRADPTRPFVFRAWPFVIALETPLPAGGPGS